MNGPSNLATTATADPETNIAIPPGSLFFRADVERLILADRNRNLAEPTKEHQ